jgi:hypothetical protein
MMRRTEAVYIRWENGAGEEMEEMGGRERGRERRSGGGSSSTCYSQQRLGSINYGLTIQIRHFHRIVSYRFPQNLTVNKCS